MFANNEIGTIQPIKEIGRIAMKKEYIFIQMWFAIGHIRIDVDELNIDMLSMRLISFRPKGIGALYIRPGKNRSTYFRRSRKKSELELKMYLNVGMGKL